MIKQQLQKNIAPPTEILLSGNAPRKHSYAINHAASYFTRYLEKTRFRIKFKVNEKGFGPLK